MLCLENHASQNVLGPLEFVDRGSGCAEQQRGWLGYKQNGLASKVPPQTAAFNRFSPTPTTGSAFGPPRRPPTLNIINLLQRTSDVRTTSAVNMSAVLVTGHRLYRHAELAVSSLAVAETIASTLTRRGWPA